MSEFRKFVATPAGLNSSETQPKQFIESATQMEETQPKIISSETQMNSVEMPDANINTENGSKKHRERATHERAARWAKIILKISRVNGYDDELRVKRDDNTYVSNSNVIALVNHTLTQRKKLTGLPELINLLHIANVEPELIVNEDIKAKLYLMRSSNKIDQQTQANEVSPKVIKFGRTKNAGTTTEEVSRKRPKTIADKELDKTLGIESSEEKYRRLENEPTDVAPTDIKWETFEDEGHHDASMLNLPDDDADDL